MWINFKPFTANGLIRFCVETVLFFLKNPYCSLKQIRYADRHSVFDNQNNIYQVAESVLPSGSSSTSAATTKTTAATTTG